MKRFFSIFILSFFLTNFSLLPCQCAEVEDQPKCCNSDSINKTTFNKNKSCCERCLSPLVASDAVEKAVISKGAGHKLDNLSLVSTRYKPVTPDADLVPVISECDSSFLSSVFKIAYSPRAPPYS